MCLYVGFRTPILRPCFRYNFGLFFKVELRKRVAYKADLCVLCVFCRRRRRSRSWALAQRLAKINYSRKRCFVPRHSRQICKQGHGWEAVCLSYVVRSNNLTPFRYICRQAMSSHYLMTGSCSWPIILKRIGVSLQAPRIHYRLARHLKGTFSVNVGRT